ncbi:MAG: hypothetical protein ACLTDR_10905 [Adlercreutzia equolifaciens]
MVYDERDTRKAQALDIAQKMLVAARTAPKGKGVDVVECAVVDGDDLEALACTMEAIGEERGFAFFLRDAGCVRKASAWRSWARARRPRGSTAATAVSPPAASARQAFPAR